MLLPNYHYDQYYYHNCCFSSSCGSCCTITTKPNWQQQSSPKLAPAALPATAATASAAQAMAPASTSTYQRYRQYEQHVVVAVATDLENHEPLHFVFQKWWAPNCWGHCMLPEQPQLVLRSAVGMTASSETAWWQLNIQRNKRHEMKSREITATCTLEMRYLQLEGLQRLACHRQPP